MLGLFRGMLRDRKLIVEDVQNIYFDHTNANIKVFACSLVYRQESIDKNVVNTVFAQEGTPNIIVVTLTINKL